MPYIGKQLVRGQNRKLDDISSGFNGSQTTFTLQVASQNVTVGSALQLWISVGGVIQNPLTDFTIAGNQITFTTAPGSGLDFFGVIQGDVTDTNTPGDATVTTSKLSTGLTVNLADGSAATSSLQLGGTDSGLFSSAADKVNVTTGGVERLEIGDSEVVFNDPSNDVDFRVESNGNANMLFIDGGNDRVGVGIGTPTSVLDVRDTQTGAASEIKLFNLDQGNTTTQTSALVMTPDVRANGAKIAVVKEIADFSSTANRDLAITFSPVVNNTATEKMRIDSSGNVGIGTTSPNQTLKVVKSSSGGTVIEFSDNVNATGRLGTPSNQVVSFGGNTNHTIAFGGYSTDGSTFSDERMRITSAGNVGVGTTNPGGKQEIAHTAGLPVTSGTTQTHGALRFSASGSNIVLDIGNSGSTGAWLQVGNKTSLIPGNSQELLLNPNGGNVGIGTTAPAHALDVRNGSTGVIVARQTTNNGGFNIYEGDDSSGNTKFYVSHNGRVGASEGIIFGSDTASANVLDDYEEGTFTPAFSFSNLSVSSYGVQQGSYVKAGRMVHVNVYIRFSGSDLSGTPQTSGAVYINLPFAGGTGYSDTQWLSEPAALGRLAEFRGTNDSTNFDRIYHYIGNTSSSMYFGVNKQPASPQSTDFLYGMSEKSFNGLIGQANNFEYRHSFTYETSS